MPPEKPINRNGKDVTYFEIITREASPHLKDYGIALNFEGYFDTIEKYKKLSLDQLDEAWKLTLELNAWSEYFSEVSNVVQRILLDSELEGTKLQAYKSISHDSEKVSNGNRFSNSDTDVINVKKKRNAIKAFYDELGAKISFVERAYYHCKATYEMGSKARMGSIF